MDRELWPLTFIIESGLDRVKVNKRARYLGQRSFRSNVVVRKHRHTRTVNRPLYTATKVVGGVNFG